MTHIVAVFLSSPLMQKSLESVTDKYKNKYRIPTTRLQGYDYGSAGCYYVTICTKNRMHYFGEISDGKMCLSEIGMIAKKEWLKTAEIRSDMNLLLDEFIVMPDHFHCIICINDNQYNYHCRDTMHCVSTLSPTSLTKSSTNKFGVQSKNLASVMRGFKMAVTTYAKKHNIEFAWQAGFYDRIIRNSNELNYVRSYILNNPKRIT